MPVSKMEKLVCNHLLIVPVIILGIYVTLHLRFKNIYSTVGTVFSSLITIFGVMDWVLLFLVKTRGGNG